MSRQPVVAPGPPVEDRMPLNGIDHLELYVGNAKQAAFYFCSGFGFREIAYAGLETGVRDRVSHVVRQGRITLVLTGALSSDSEIAGHHHRHGDGMKVIALSVPDADRAYRRALERGARGVAEPQRTEDEHGAVRLATVATYGETVHTFVERAGYAGAFLPGYAPRAGTTTGAGLLTVDHVVGNVALGHMQEWVTFYEDVFDMTEMTRFTDEDIATEYSALMSKVVADGKGRVKFPINEPAAGRRRSQIDEYLQYYEGAGAQHLAVATRDIVATVEHLAARGVGFLRTPESYYDRVPDRVGEIAEDVADLRRLGILVDRDDEGYLLQVFTKPIGDRPTVFLEIIERHGARGFGEGNFRALFEAIERDQDARGNL